MKNLFARIRANEVRVVAYLALFVALGGVSYAATQLPANSVGPRQIRSQAVKQVDIAASAVTSAKIRDGSLRAVDLADGPGSGVDADSFDGLDSSSYARKIVEGTTAWDPAPLDPDDCTFRSFTSPTPLLPTDKAIATVTGGLVVFFQVTADIAGDKIFATMCNNGATQIDQTQLTLNVLVIR